MERRSKQLSYYYDNKEKRLEYQQKYQEENKERCREYAKEYYKTKGRKKKNLKTDTDVSVFRIEHATNESPFILKFDD